jgi:putative copper export protein/methionine-rich copper-binding protein CopC
MRQTGRVRYLTKGLIALALAVGVLIVFAYPAEAHSNLVGSEPEAGSVVRQLDRVVLRFAEPVETAGVHVWIDDDGGTYELGPAQHLDGDDRAIVVAVPRIASGRYTVGFHLIADDGDVATGSFGFGYDAPPAPGVADEPLPPVVPTLDASTAIVHQDHGDDLPAGAARVIIDATLATLVGGLAFIATVWPQGASFAGTRRLLWSAAVVAALASFELAVIQHAGATGLGLAQAIAPAHLWESMQFRFARVAAARLVLLAVAAVLATRLRRGGEATARSVPWCAAASVVAVGLFETVVLLAHTGGGGGTVVEGARLVHTIGVSIWLGGLLMLFVVVFPRRRTDELLAVLPRFSTLATVAVGSVIVAGVVLSVDLVGAAGALPTTDYGRLLLLKLAVVVVLLAVASRSRDAVRRQLSRATSRNGRAAVAAPVATLVGIELGLMTVVLALTALLVSHAPPA